MTEVHTDSCDDADYWVGCEERAGVAASGEATEAKTPPNLKSLGQERQEASSGRCTKSLGAWPTS